MLLRQVHKNITGYMGDRSSKKKPLDHIKKMLKGVLSQSSDKLSDETFCQLCKQTNLNPNPESLHKVVVVKKATSCCTGVKKIVVHVYLRETESARERESECVCVCVRLCSRVHVPEWFVKLPY
jgi:hypothetical protein